MFDELKLIPAVIIPAEVTLETVLLKTWVPFADHPTFIPVNGPVPRVILLKILFDIVLTGQFACVDPSLLNQPLNPVAPVKVILEKLLLFTVTVEPVAELSAELYTVTTPPAPVFVNAPTILLSETVLEEVAVGIVAVLLIKVAPPVVDNDKFVNVLLTIVVVWGVEEQLINITTPELAAIVCPKLLKSLLEIDKLEVVLEVVAATSRPAIPPANKPVFTLRVLLLILFANVPMGAIVMLGQKYLW